LTEEELRDQNVRFSSFSSGIFLGFLLLNVDGDDMKMKKRRRRRRKPNVFELKLTERTKMCNREKLKTKINQILVRGPNRYYLNS